MAENTSIEPKERPILFSSAMVLALLAGTKTQTRRALRVQPNSHYWEKLPGYELKQSKIVTINDRSAVKFSHSIPQNQHWDTALDWLLCPYGQPGDRLWVRESFWGCDLPGYGDQPCVVYDDEWHGKEYAPAATRPWARKFGRIPSIHMPRDCSRILLEVTDIRVQRLQAISEADAIAEGIEPNPAWGGTYRDYSTERERQVWTLPPIDSYRTLWESINGVGSWGKNSWVWAITFRRLEQRHGRA